MRFGEEQLASRSVHILVKGRVQGVFYRQSTREEALKLGLCGYVRNLSDGSVEALACGEAEKVQILIDFCRQGPPRAQVEELQLTELEKSQFDSKTPFHIAGDGNQPICLDPGPSKSL